MITITFIQTIEVDRVDCGCLPFSSDRSGTDIEVANEITVFPNPSIGDNLFVQLSEAFSSDLHISIYSADGKLIHDFVDYQYSEKIRLMNLGLTTGHYFIKIIDTTGVMESTIFEIKTN